MLSSGRDAPSSRCVYPEGINERREDHRAEYDAVASAMDHPSVGPRRLRRKGGLPGKRINGSAICGGIGPVTLKARFSAQPSGVDDEGTSMKVSGTSTFM
jgi:hypothetical protein